MPSLNSRLNSRVFKPKPKPTEQTPLTRKPIRKPTRKPMTESTRKPIRKPERKSASAKPQRRSASRATSKAKPRSLRRGGGGDAMITLRRLFVLGVVLCFFSLIAGAYWVVTSDKITRAKDYLVYSSGELLKRNGFALEHVIVDGRIRTQKNLLLKALNVTKGDFIYNIDVPSKLEAVEALPWVQSTRIERRLPDTLYVKLIERHPIGFLQKNKQHFLVDTDGAIIGAFPLKEFPGYIVATGEGANEKLPSLIEALSPYDSVYAKVTGAVYHSHRRWDLILDNRVTVKLPEDNMEEALKRVFELDSENRLLSPKIDTIDLRSDGRVYFYMSKDGKAFKAKRA